MTKAEIIKLVEERASIHCQKMDLMPSKIVIKGQRSRWGSCSSRTRRITLNWRLAKAPVEIIDYVIIHELGHLKHPNHSREFWQFVAGYAPEYKKHRKWLRLRGKELFSKEERE